MARTWPLVVRLFVVSLVAWAVVEPSPTSTSLLETHADVLPTTKLAPVPPTRPPKAQRKQRRRRTTTTTTTTTIDPYELEFEDVDETTTTQLPTTTLDPRHYDHTERGSCEVPLGMENGKISNESLTASSSYDQSVSPLSARVRTEIRGGAWCPNGLIHSRSRQYLQVDLHQEFLITGTETQGRFANSVGVEFVESYGIEYWRPKLNRWIRYRDPNGTKVLMPGNSNTYTPVKWTLENPFVAQKIRFFPYSHHPRTACMRIEIYGCLWKQAIISYTAPRGGIMTAMAAGALFTDVSYDGLYRNGLAYDGLGQMTDSILGPSDFELLDEDPAGSRWVGWNRTVVKDPVVIVFNFSEPRLFRYVEIHTNNMFTKDVQLFRNARIYFSIEGERWQEEYISYDPKQDRVSEHARIINITLDNRTATHVKIQLTFQHQWILLSEVTFKSEPTTVNRSTEFLDKYYTTDIPPNQRGTPHTRDYSISFSIACGGIVAGGCCLAALGFVLTRALKRGFPELWKRPFCPRIALGGGSQARNNRRTPRLALALANCPPIHMMRPAIVDEDYREPYNIWRETLGRHSLKPVQHDIINPDQNEYNEICEESDLPRPYMMRRAEPAENFYAATDIIHHTYPEDRHLQHERPCPGLFTSIKLPEAEPPNGVAPLLDFPRGRMRPVTFLGEGPHGTVQVFETDGIDELSDEEVDARRRRLVVVKTLWRGCHSDVKAAFAREATWGAGLKHPQLARVLGLSLQEPPCAALDRGDAAPLPILLRADNKLNYGSLIHICCQIAAGMKYLESFELVHRDLSARNVTVSENLTVKISDYAMFCREYITDYHIMADGSKVPLRWMAWENILLNMFSPASDVWSFGVTVWEVVTHCDMKPFEEMTDDQVVENAENWRRGTMKARVPAAPLPRCRRELYDLMHECWRREPSHRPRFHDLHCYLEAMTHGFKPPLPR